MLQTVKNAKLVNGDIVTIIIKDGRIARISKTEETVGQLIEANGMYVSPGWIDLHTHAFPKYAPYCSYPDDIGYQTGVTTVVDAGSSGADDIDEFYDIAKKAKTRVFSLLNISRIGLGKQNELADLTSISYQAMKRAIVKYPDFIIGLKARMSASVVGNNGLRPLQLAKKLCKQVKLPIMVHIGSAPPNLVDVLQCLEKGDIVTHCFHEKDGNHIFTNDLTVEPALFQAIRRGVYLDVGHGTSSFSFHIAKKAKEAGVHFDSIGTDIYQQNQVNGPVYDMATTLSKFLVLGYRLEEVIRGVTELPAKMINRPTLGRLVEGANGDLTFFSVEEQAVSLQDSLGNSLTSRFVIKPKAVLLGGEFIELESNY